MSDGAGVSVGAAATGATGATQESVGGGQEVKQSSYRPSTNGLFSQLSPPDISKMVGEDGNITPDVFTRYNQEKGNYERMSKFQNEFGQMLTKPMQFGELTVDFSDQADFDGMVNMIRRVSSEGLSPAEYAKLHFFDRSLKLAQEHGGRTYEQSLKNGKGVEGQQVVQSAGEIVTPKNVNATTSGKKETAVSAISNRVPGVGEMMKQANPALYEQIMSGKAKLPIR